MVLLTMKFKKHVVKFNLTRIKENCINVLGGLALAASVFIIPIIITILFGGY